MPDLTPEERAAMEEQAVRVCGTSSIRRGAFRDGYAFAREHDKQPKGASNEAQNEAASGVGRTCGREIGSATETSSLATDGPAGPQGSDGIPGRVGEHDKQEVERAEARALEYEREATQAKLDVQAEEILAASHRRRAERAEELERLLREALEFYAQQRGLGAVLASDGGQRARAALAASPGQAGVA